LATSRARTIAAKRPLANKCAAVDPSRFALLLVRDAARKRVSRTDGPVDRGLERFSADRGVLFRPRRDSW
jgi:hypothetical protein